MLPTKQILAVAPILLNAAFALPKPATDLEARLETNILAPTLVGVYMCTDADWKGNCKHLLNGPGLCINLPKELAGQVSSVGPDQEPSRAASGCTLYEKPNCAGQTMSDITYPGEPNLGQVYAGNYNDYFNSYICY